MTFSLFDLANTGQYPKLKTLDIIHYPDDGAQGLAAIEQNHFWFVERRKIIKSLIKKYCKAKDHIKGADVGCGSGYTAVWLTEGGFPTIGIDGHNGFRSFQDKKRGVGFIQGDILSIEPEAEFDFVLLLDTLEHIEDDKKFVNHISKMLKPGGLLIISVPAFQYLWSNVDKESGHFRRYIKKDLNKFLNLEYSKLRLVRSFYFYITTLPFYFLHRKVIKVSSRSDSELNPHFIVNSVLKGLLKLERTLILPLSLNMGTSLFAVFRKIE